MFTVEQIKQLNPEEKNAVQMVADNLHNSSWNSLWGESTNLDDEDVAVQEAFELISLVEGCVPDGWCEELDQAIISKFFAIYGTAKQLAEQRIESKVNRHFYITCCIQPSSEDRTIVVIYKDDVVLYETGLKAWHVGFNTLKHLAKEILEIAAEIERRVLLCPQLYSDVFEGNANG